MTIHRFVRASPLLDRPDHGRLLAAYAGCLGDGGCLGCLGLGRAGVGAFGSSRIVLKGLQCLKIRAQTV